MYLDLGLSGYGDRHRDRQKAGIGNRSIFPQQLNIILMIFTKI
ncbi:hypothetical protein [Chamaesiphon polymorphus]|nr:hypothetical protein [Chamaesiphon polymorphus]